MSTVASQDSSLIGQRTLRLEKLEQLKSLGINPYPAKSGRTHHNQEVAGDFAKLENQQVTIAGRMQNSRTHGKIMFIDVVDQTGKIQAYIKQDVLQELGQETQNLGWDELHLLDSGDFIEVTGQVTKTERGEVSVLAERIKLLSKAIRPMPTELNDKEDRYRRRYIDMNVHPEVRERFVRRSKFWDAIRDFLNEKGFVEINIPVLEHVTGGADANPFKTHYDALDQDFYLRISHELPLKRLIGAGFEKVYDIGPRFRNEGFSDEHLPEHIAMEWYWAYSDYRDGMALTTDMFRTVMQKVYGTQKFSMRGFDVDLSKDWEEIHYVDIIQERFGVNVLEDDVAKMNQILKDNGVDLGQDATRPRVADNLWKLIRKTIPGPAFLLGVPKEFSPLAKTNQDNILVCDRFHPIIAGSELANAYSELNDPVDQLGRFLEQQAMRDAGDDEAQMLDIDYVEMLEYGMPPAVGFGLSERVFWFFEGVTAKEGVPFPQLKMDTDNLTKEIYPQVFREKKAAPEPAAGNDKIDFTNSQMPTREQASEFLHKYVTNEYQLHHAEMVAKALEAVATKLGESDVEKFYVAGLIHDWDFDQWPDEHPGRYEQLVGELGVDQEVVEAIKGHADLNHPRLTNLAKALLACDELSGLYYAYMKMVGSFGDMKISSIQKKIHKEVNFAAKINREDVKTGITELGIPEEELLTLLRDTFAASYDNK
ncbi:lysine--tRNA ligase [Candidatus Dojkabacteria bacterium]|uniref:Lysine--tRNA ligase n=1 Tax=Candidatus Dojkabacteria bacterium TaxID=2099670 RepID=A0A955I5G9_9BACT|nr:lysine--tRNA ligase [Candidatus Dojkabacteria bacterium]